MNKEEITLRLNRNLDRVRNLVNIYEISAGPGQGRRPVNSTDVLRAAVVFLHASLEDFLRNVAQERLPQAAENVLNDVPLAGSATIRAEKFYLGKLVNHRNKTVDALIKESVEWHLKRSNYNDPDDVANVIMSAGLDPDPCRIHFALLKDMMMRRHWIVHRADENQHRGRGEHIAQGINKETVRVWTATVREVANAVLAQIP